MNKRAAICGVLWAALLAGCDNPEAGVSEAEASPPASEAPLQTETASAPAAPPAPAPAIVGCWQHTTPAVTETLSVDADGSCSEVIVAQRTIREAPYTQIVTQACTWTPTDSSEATFVYAGPQSWLCTYAADGDALTLFCPYMSEAVTYQRTACN